MISHVERQPRSKTIILITKKHMMSTNAWPCKSKIALGHYRPSEACVRIRIELLSVCCVCHSPHVYDVVGEIHNIIFNVTILLYPIFTQCRRWHLDMIIRYGWRGDFRAPVLSWFYGDDLLVFLVTEMQMCNLYSTCLRPWLFSPNYKQIYTP